MKIDTKLSEKDKCKIYFDAIKKGKLDNSRLQYDNEIVIENDDLLNKVDVGKWLNGTCKKLKKANYSFKVFDYNGKSPYIHIYNIKGLKELPRKERR